MLSSHMDEGMCVQLDDENIWADRDEMRITEPFEYLKTLPGKDVRGRLVDAFNSWLQVPPECLPIISSIVGMLHQASLLIDDIEDNSQLRRGSPVAHKIYGLAQTINCGNYIYFVAVQKASLLVPYQRKDCDAVGIILSELLNLHRGQGLDIWWRDSLECPSEAQYVDMVNKKTGGLLRIAVKLMMACATEHRDVNFVRLVNLIGVFFQIRDDLMNLDSTEYEKNKGFAEDLTEGKFSFPVIHGIHSRPETKLLTNVLQKRPSTPNVKIYAINHLRHQTQSFEYSKSVLGHLESEIRAEIQALGGNEVLSSLVDMLAVATHSTTAVTTPESSQIDIS